MNPQEYTFELKIPKERIGALIGSKGKDKRKIEERTSTKISVDSKEGDIKVSGDDPIGLFIAKDIIKAIGRGFNPDIAKLLTNDDYVLEVISINDYSGKSKSAELRIKGRIIGSKGKSRNVIEKITGSYISVYGKTVSILGEAENTQAARKAVESLLRGAKHSNVYKALENWRRKRRTETKTGHLE